MVFTLEALFLSPRSVPTMCLILGISDKKEAQNVNKETDVVINRCSTTLILITQNLNSKIFDTKNESCYINQINIRKMRSSFF